MKKNKKALVLLVALILLLSNTSIATSQVTEHAGEGDSKYGDGLLSEAYFNQPGGMCLGEKGQLLIADTYNNRIRSIEGNNVTTIAGTSVAKDGLGFPLGALKDADVAQAYFNRPRDLVCAQNGDLYVADTDNHVIRKIAGGKVITFSGVGKAGFVDGKANEAKFNKPSGIAMDAKGIIYVADTMNNAIRTIDSKGFVTTMRLISSSNTMDYSSLNEPQDICFDDAGALYISDSGNQMIKKVVAGVVYLVAGGQAGKDELGYVEGGYMDGDVLQARFNFPKSIVVKEGLVFVADTWNNAIRVVKQDKTVVTLAGNGTAGDERGALLSAAFNGPSGLLINGDSLFVSDQWNNNIKAINLEYGNPIFDLQEEYAEKDIDFSGKNDADVNVCVDKKLLAYTDIQPINMNGSTYFPLRIIAEKLGAKVDYDLVTRTVVIEYNGNIIRYPLDSKEILVNNNRSLIHIRTLATDLGFFVTWLKSYHTVVITRPNDVKQP